MARDKEREELEQSFVNAYRNAWGTNSGLSTAKLNKLSKATLKRNTRSLQDFASRRR